MWLTTGWARQVSPFTPKSGLEFLALMVKKKPIKMFFVFKLFFFFYCQLMDVMVNIKKEHSRILSAIPSGVPVHHIDSRTSLTLLVSDPDRNSPSIIYSMHYDIGVSGLCYWKRAWAASLAGGLQLFRLRSCSNFPLFSQWQREVLHWVTAQFLDFLWPLPLISLYNCCHCILGFYWCENFLFV